MEVSSRSLDQRDKSWANMDTDSLKNDGIFDEESLGIGAWVGVHNFKGCKFMPDSAGAELCISLDNN